MPEPDKNPWKIEGVKAIASIVAAVILGITTGAWVMYKQVDKLTDKNTVLTEQVEALNQNVKKLQDDRASVARKDWESLLQRVAKLEGVQDRGGVLLPSSIPAQSTDIPPPIHPPAAGTPAPAAGPIAGNNPLANPGPLTLPSPAPAKATVTAEGLTAEVTRTKKTANGVVFQVRITSPDRKAMVFMQHYRDYYSRAALNERGPQNLTFADHEDASEMQRKPTLSLSVNAGSPMIFYAFAPGESKASDGGAGSCRELSLFARLTDGTPVNFVLTSFPLD
jgi:hypothetical protein